MPERDLIFICYSRKDQVPRLDFRELFEQGLSGVKNSQGKNSIQFFSDQDIQPGTKWLEEIKDSINRTRVALLLEGPGFMASDFIMKKEVPDFLGEAYKERKIEIFRVPIRAVPGVAVPESLASIQAVWDIEKPLADLRRSQRDKAIAFIVDRLIEKYNVDREGQDGDIDELERAKFPYSPPFTIKIDSNSNLLNDIYLSPSAILKWWGSIGVENINLSLEKSFEKYLLDMAHSEEYLNPAWRLIIPTQPPVQIMDFVNDYQSLELESARLYPRYRDAHLALFTCLNGKDVDPILEFEAIKHAKGIMKALFRKHPILWTCGNSLTNPFDESGLNEFLFALKCMPICELGILMRLEHACEFERGKHPQNSLKLSYILLDRMCHWMRATNRLMNKILGG